MNGCGKSDSSVVARKSPNEATELAEEATEPRELAEGNSGIVLSLLEQDAAGNPAQPSDLDTWIQTYHVNYPMAIDPEENVATGTNIQAWPGNIILDLSTMKVVKAEYGNNPTFFQSFDTILGG